MTKRTNHLASFQISLNNLNYNGRKQKKINITYPALPAIGMDVEARTYCHHRAVTSVNINMPGAAPPNSMQPPHVM